MKKLIVVLFVIAFVVGLCGDLVVTVSFAQENKAADVPKPAVKQLSPETKLKIVQSQLEQAKLIMQYTNLNGQMEELKKQNDKLVQEINTTVAAATEKECGGAKDWFISQDTLVCTKRPDQPKPVAKADPAKKEQK